MYNYEQLKKGEKVLPHQEEAAAASTSLYHFEDNTPPIETQEAPKTNATEDFAKKTLPSKP